MHILVVLNHQYIHLNYLVHKTLQISEYQDYNHGNLYHYVCEFFANLTDSKGSKYDPDAGNFDESIVDNLDLSTVKSDTGGETPGPTSDYIIPQTH